MCPELLKRRREASPQSPLPSSKKFKVISVFSSDISENDITLSGVSIRPSDFDSLKPGHCLTDHKFNGFLALIASDKFLVLDTYFWKMLKVRRTEVGLKWTTKDKLETFSICFVPLHSEEKFHWGLDVPLKDTGNIAIYGSLQSMESFSSSPKPIVAWANWEQNAYGLGIWPERWTEDKTCGLSLNKENMPDCGVYFCLNKLFLSESKKPSFLPTESSEFRMQTRTSLLRTALMVDI